MGLLNMEIDHFLGIQADWLDDDRLGAMLEGLADHAVEIWSTNHQEGCGRFQGRVGMAAFRHDQCVF